MLSPTPILLFINGASIPSTPDFGAPSKLTHCARYNRLAQMASLLPADAGFTHNLLNMFWLNCGSCCATATVERHPTASTVKSFFIQISIDFGLFEGDKVSKYYLQTQKTTFGRFI